MQFFCLVNGTPNKVPLHQMKFKVDGDECAMVGTWYNGKPWQPNKEQFRAALPSRWRQAFDREYQGVAFWHDRHKDQCNISLSDARGRYLVTIYCQPVVESDE